MHFASTPALPRRHFLRGLGAAVSLPFLDAMSPAFGRSQPPSPKRTVAICTGLGIHKPFLIPEKTGRDYETTPYLKKLDGLRDDFTLLSGLSHPEQNGANGHSSELTWLTSARHPGLAGFKNSISLDQVIARTVGHETRHPYLALGTGGNSLAWTDTGVSIPSEIHPSKLFRRLFVQGTEKEIAAEQRGYQSGRSVLDAVLGEAGRLQRDLGHRDREKLDEYLTSVRELEVRLQQREDWSALPKPVVDVEEPRDAADRNDLIEKQRLMFDMIVLALQTDSTRTITLYVSGMNAPPSNIPGVTADWHNLSHHGKDAAKIAELRRIEEAKFTVFGEFLHKMKGVKENGRSLLDHSAVLYGSNLGNASAHDWRNLPLLLAGGGYRHGSHLAADPENNLPFANLLLGLAQRAGVEADRFGSSTAAGVAGLELG